MVKANLLNVFILIKQILIFIVIIPFWPYKEAEENLYGSR